MTTDPRRSGPGWVYHEETEPLKHFYEKRGKLDTVPGDLGTIEDTTRAIKQVLEASH